jgi:hypothetical protein
MNTRIEIFYEKLSITFIICKFGLFVSVLLEILNKKAAEQFIDELKIMCLECVFMLICIVIYSLLKTYFREVLVLPNNLQLEREE